MKALKIATAQFENKSADKAYNLSVIERLSKEAAEKGADVIAFHECSVHGYTFARNLTKEQMLETAENFSDSPSLRRLQKIASDNDIHILAGLFEKDDQDVIRKAQVCVNKDGLVAKFHKLHPFINSNITPGDSY